MRIYDRLLCCRCCKASAQMLLTGMTIDKVSLMTPKGILLELNIKNSEIETDYAECAIKKDSGDDPDVTNGILVYARVEKNSFRE